MRIASGSALFVACLVVASSANGKSENASVTLPPQRDGRRVTSLGTRSKKRELYGDLAIDGATEGVEIRKVTPILASRPESKGSESASDRPQEPLEDLLHDSIGNLSIPLEDSCTWAAPPASPSKHSTPTQAQGFSDQPAFPSDLRLLEPSIDAHEPPPMYSDPPNTPSMGSAAFFLSNPPLSRALAHCSTSLSIWCSVNQKPTNLADHPGTHAESQTPHHGCSPSKLPLTGEVDMFPSLDQEGMGGCDDGANGSVGTHIADGGWMSNLVQTLSR